MLMITDVFSKFFLKIKDYDFIKMDRLDIEECMIGWIRSTISKPYVRKIFNSCSVDEVEMSITYSLKNSIGDEESDNEYVSDLLAIGMVIEWLEPKVNSVTNIAQLIGGKEEKFYAQSNHLSVIKQLLSDHKVELKKNIRDHGYLYNNFINSEE